LTFSRKMAAMAVALSSLAIAQEANVRGTASVVHAIKSDVGSGDVVVWLTSTSSKDRVAPGPTVRLLQKGKRFTPHMLAVTAGTSIEFPNQDPFFHDVFSIYHGKPFDLGLYESGAVRKVRFTQPGVSYIFCNIHPDMSAVVIALSTPHFAVTVRDGSFRILYVPPGRYRLGVWYEFASDAELAVLSRDVELAAGEVALGTLTIHATNVPHEHLNKYGETYPLDRSTKY
jgi:plastocyanin